MDPNTEAFVRLTTFIVCLFFAIGAWLPAALLVHWFVGLVA